MKTFITVWGDGYTNLGGQAIVETQPLDFFSPDVGYPPDTKTTVGSLEVGQCHQVDDDCGWQSIVRIK